MPSQTKELSAKTLLEKVYNNLSKKYDGKVINFQYKAYAEIADDSDWHRTRKGYTGYDSATIITLNGTEWLVALGNAFGSYPADDFNCDIFAKQCSTKDLTAEKLQERAYKELSINRYFGWSIIAAMDNGQLFSFDKDMKLEIYSQISNFIVEPKKADYDTFYLYSESHPFVMKNGTYKSKFIHFLTNLIVKRLEQKAE